MKRLFLMRQAARVERMHTQPVARPQTVGEHTFGVLVLIDHVAPEMTINLWRAVLYHDVPEAITGDVPATAKWKYPNTIGESIKTVEALIVKQYDLGVGLSDKEEKVLKFCDTMELLIFSIEEAERGDKNTIRVAWNCADYLTKSTLFEVTEKAAQLFHYVLHYLSKNFKNRGVLFNDRGE